MGLLRLLRFAYRVVGRFFLIADLPCRKGCLETIALQGFRQLSKIYRSQMRQALGL